MWVWCRLLKIKTCLGGRHQGTSLPRLSTVQEESFWVVSLCFLSPSLPLGAAEPAIVQEEPSAQGAYHRARGTNRRLRWLIISSRWPRISPRLSRQSQHTQHTQPPPAWPGRRSGSGEDAEAVPERECAGGRAGEQASVRSQSQRGAQGQVWRQAGRGAGTSRHSPLHPPPPPRLWALAAIPA